MSAKRKRQQARMREKQKLANEHRRATSERQSIARELNDRPGDHSFGTSPASLGRVKAESEEARLVQCAECGYSGGRHSRFCGLA